MYEIITLGIVLSGLLMIFRSRVAFNLLWATLLFAILFPFTAPLIKGGESWLLLIFAVVFALLLLQGLAALIFGQRAADSVVASLISNVLLAPFRVLIGFFRTLFFR
jgi:glucose-6-phosphate-specific signal transduction histidine kinase